MIKDHRPYYIKWLSMCFESWYAQHFLAPQCEVFGQHLMFMKPWYIEIFGAPISIGDYTTLIATPDKRIRLTSWMTEEGSGKIDVGRFCLICPGTRILSATSIRLGDDCMLAQNVCITDADWHGLYDRSATIGNTAEVVIENNVWIGDGALIGKGVHIGENSVIGAGAVVVKDIPENTIAAGNPACVVRPLDTDKPIRKRSHWMAEPEILRNYFDSVERKRRKDNSLFKWIRSMVHPRKGD